LRAVVADVTGAGVSEGMASPVATAVAQRQLGMLRFAGNEMPKVDWDIGWAGPVDLPLEDELSVQAPVGLCTCTVARWPPGGLGIDYASTVAGVLAAQGVLAAWWLGVAAPPSAVSERLSHRRRC